jgi:alkylhydroperoxidase family enzyme
VARIDVPDGDGGEVRQIWTLRPELGLAVANLSKAAYHDSILPPRVREAARMRIAQLNDCPI